MFRSEPDKGLYDAMNKALLQATGDYILFLNAGDKFHTSTTLSDIAAQLPASSDRNTLPAVLYGDTHLVDDNGTFCAPADFRLPNNFICTILSTVCSCVTKRFSPAPIWLASNPTISATAFRPTTIGASA